MTESLVYTVTDLRDFLLGAAIVALFYWFRFHSLKGTRSYTTLALYWSGISTFILPFVLIYLLLVLRLSSPPLLAVWILILVWLVPVLPRAWRDFCHTLAQIPFYANRVQNALANSPFELRSEDTSAVRRILSRLGYQIDDFTAVQSTTIQARFLKIVAIMHHLDRWNEKHEAFMERRYEQYAELLRTFDLLSFRYVRSLKYAAAIYSGIMEDSKVQSEDWHSLQYLSTEDSSHSRLHAAAKAAAGCMLEDLRKDLDLLLDNLFQFIARATLASERNFAGRKRRLEAIGFSLARPAPSIIPTLGKVGAITVAWSLVWFLFLGDQIAITGPRHIGILRTFSLPLLNLVINLMLVVFFKRNFAFANQGIFGEYPIGFILSVGIMTAVLMIPIRTFFDIYQLPNPDNSNILWDNLLSSIFPWVTGAIIATLVQDSVWSRLKSEQTKRVMDGAVLGTSMALTVSLVLAINVLKPLPLMRALPASLHYLEIIASLFVLGLAVGYFVIARVRETLSLGFSQRAAISRSSLVNV